MQINRTTDYALRILLYLSREKRPVPSSEMANNMRISRRYLLSISRDLKAHGYIKAGMGPDGGFSLATPLNQITLYEIITLMEGTITISRCLLQDNHCDDEPCVLHDVYNFLQNILVCYLGHLTIDVLLGQPSEKWRQIIMDKLLEMHCQYPNNNIPQQDPIPETLPMEQTRSCKDCV